MGSSSHDWFILIGLCALNGVPSQDTLNRIFRKLNPKIFNQYFMQWVNTIATKVERVIAVNGKTLCNSSYEFDKTEKLGVPNKRKLADWSPEYLLKVLGIKSAVVVK